MSSSYLSRLLEQRDSAYLARLVAGGDAPDARYEYTWHLPGTLGLRLQQGAGEVVIEAIKDSSLLERSKLRAGMAFESVNGEPVGDIGKFKLVDLIKAAGRPMTIVFRGARLPVAALTVRLPDATTASKSKVTEIGRMLSEAGHADEALTASSPRSEKHQRQRRASLDFKAVLEEAEAEEDAEAEQSEPQAEAAAIVEEAAAIVEAIVDEVRSTTIATAAKPEEAPAAETEELAEILAETVVELESTAAVVKSPGKMRRSPRKTRARRVTAPNYEGRVNSWLGRVLAVRPTL